MALCGSLTYALKGFGLLVLLLVYELLCFLGFLSLSIGISAAITKGYDYFFAPSTFPPTSQAFAAIYFLATFSELHIFCHRQCVRPTVALHDAAYHFSISSTAKVIYVFLFLMAYIQLFGEFQEVHISHRTPPSPFHRPPPEEHTGLSSADQWHIALFLFILAYIVYCTAKLTHYDLIKQLRQLENPASCVHCVVTLGFLIVHFLVDILYSIPLLIVAFSVRTYNYSGLSSYIHLTLTAFVSGFVFAVLESRKPFPTKRFLPPFYFHENNNRAKSSLAQLLFVLVLMAFYAPTSEGKIPANKFSAENDYVMIFCLSVSFVVLHMTKTLVYIVIDTNLRPHDIQAQLRLDAAINNVPPADGEMPLDVEELLNERRANLRDLREIDQQGFVRIQIGPSPSGLDSASSLPSRKESKLNNNNLEAAKTTLGTDDDIDDDDKLNPFIIVEDDDKLNPFIIVEDDDNLNPFLVIAKEPTESGGSIEVETDQQEQSEADITKAEDGIDKTQVEVINNNDNTEEESHQDNQEVKLSDQAKEESAGADVSQTAS